MKLPFEARASCQYSEAAMGSPSMEENRVHRHTGWQPANRLAKMLEALVAADPAAHEARSAWSAGRGEQENVVWRVR